MAKLCVLEKPGSPYYSSLVNNATNIVAEPLITRMDVLLFVFL